MSIFPIGLDMVRMRDAISRENAVPFGSGRGFHPLIYWASSCSAYHHAYQVSYSGNTSRSAAWCNSRRMRSDIAGFLSPGLAPSALLLSHSRFRPGTKSLRAESFPPPNPFPLMWWMRHVVLVVHACPSTNARLFTQFESDIVFFVVHKGMLSRSLEHINSHCVIPYLWA